MPYKDPGKRREANRERQRKHRQGVTGVTEGVTVTPSVRPQLLTPKLSVFDELKAKYGKDQGNYKPVKTQSIPMYNASVHKPGDRVLMYQGNRLVEIVIPRLDADMNPFD